MGVKAYVIIIPGKRFGRGPLHAPGTVPKPEHKARNPKQTRNNAVYQIGSPRYPDWRKSVGHMFEAQRFRLNLHGGRRC